MQLVVEISEDTFFDLKKKQNRTEVDNAVLNGTPLKQPTTEAIPKADYENRLKSDMVAMLTDIQLEINEAEMHRYDDQIDKAYNVGLHRGGEIIQLKINALKENKGNE